MPPKADAQACNGLLTLRQCTALLKPLLKMEAAQPFLLPVDPEALHIPDYLTIIKQPMDLGTIQTKLSDSRCADTPALQLRAFIQSVASIDRPSFAADLSQVSRRRVLHR